MKSSRPQTRNTVETRRRILETAAYEFSQYGFNGARVERIAETADISKPMIYFHFGCKEGLFNAVLDAELDSAMERIVLNADDLPGYAVAIFDRLHQPSRTRESICLRLRMWSRLEYDQFLTAPPRTGVYFTESVKLEKIIEAQAEGRVSNRIPAPQLFSIVCSIAMTWALDPANSQVDLDAQRRSIHEAVARLVAF